MVASFTQLLADRYADRLDRDAQEFIAFAVDGVQRMQLLIHDLLEYARTSTRQKALQPTDLGRVLDRVLEDLGPAIEESRARVTHDALPSVQGDALQLGQLLQNLIGNALKFRGEEPPRIHVGAERQGGAWRCSVRDNGIGIDPDAARGGVRRVSPPAHARPVPRQWDRPRDLQAHRRAPRRSHLGRVRARRGRDVHLHAFGRSGPGRRGLAGRSG